MSEEEVEMAVMECKSLIGTAYMQLCKARGIDQGIRDSFENQAIVIWGNATWDEIQLNLRDHDESVSRYAVEERGLGDPTTRPGAYGAKQPYPPVSCGRPMDDAKNFMARARVRYLDMRIGKYRRAIDFWGFETYGDEAWREEVEQMSRGFDEWLNPTPRPVG